MQCFLKRYYLFHTIIIPTAQKMMFFITDFFIFCAVTRFRIPEIKFVKTQQKTIPMIMEIGTFTILSRDPKKEFRNIAFRYFWFISSGDDTPPLFEKFFTFRWIPTSVSTFLEKCFARDFLYMITLIFSLNKAWISTENSKQKHLLKLTFMVFFLPLTNLNQDAHYILGI